MRKLSFTLLAIAVLSLLGRRLILVSAVEGRDQCRQQIHRMASACELYASDNAGLYPHSLDKLVPNYLSGLPDCPVPSAGRSRYQYAQSAVPKVFTLCCQGDRHALAGGQPQHSSGQSLVEP